MQKQTINTSDLYQFTGLWGKDLVADTDGSGSIQIDGQTLGAAKGAGQLNTWVAELGADSGVLVGMTVYDDARSANGMQKLVTDISGLSDAAQKAIVAQGVEWYYWQGTDYAGQEFSTRSGAVLQYTTAQGANLLGAQDRASSYVRPWLDELYTANTGDTRFAPMGTGFGQWNVATSATAGAVALARDLDQTQMFIGQGGNDTFNGGNGYGFFWASAQACNDTAWRLAA